MSRATAHRIRILEALIWVIAAGAACAQETAVRQPRGLSLESVSIFSAYFSQDLPPAARRPEDIELGSDEAAGGAATIQWNRIREKSYFTMRDQSSYVSRFQRPIRGWNQDFSFAMRQRLAPKWSWGNQGAASLWNSEQSLFNGTRLGALLSAPTTFDELASAALKDPSDNPALADVGGLEADTSIARFLYGRRTASLSWKSTLSYAHSPRLRIWFTGDALKFRQLPPEGSPAVFRSVSNLVAGGGINVGYALSPRTQIGGEAHVTRMVSRQTRSRNTLSSASLGRTMGRRWFLRATAGIGVIEMESGARQSTFIGSIGAGFKTFSHSFMAVFDRSTRDSYLNAVGVMSLRDSVNGAWRWSPPGRGWWAGADYSYAIASWTLPGHPTVDTWMVMAALGRNLTPHLALLSQCVISRIGAKRYIQAGIGYQLEQNAVRISLVWHPRFAFR